MVERARSWSFLVACSYCLLPVAAFCLLLLSLRIAAVPASLLLPLCYNRERTLQSISRVEVSRVTCMSLVTRTSVLTHVCALPVTSFCIQNCAIFVS